MNPTLSIIIPTYMREKILWETITSLSAQLRGQDELLIIDQNVPPLQIPESQKKPWPKLYHLKTPSLTKARNLGIKKALHQTLVFLDDDIIPDPELLNSIRAVTLENPNCILTGVVDQEDKSNQIPSPGTINLRTGAIKTNFSRPLSGEVSFFPGGLAIIPRSCLPTPPYFCPAFKGASQGEEIDFALRIKSMGKKIIADPSIRIFHLKILEGGCRSPQFKKQFFLNHVFNESLFFARQGFLGSTLLFLQRMKSFIEFYSRYPGKRRHRLSVIISALIQLSLGYFTGIWHRVTGTA